MKIRKKKVALIGTNGVPAKYGGFETLTDFLAKSLDEEFDITVYCSQTPRDQRLEKYNNSNLIYLPFKANGWQSMIYDAVSIVHALLTKDVLVILGFSGAIAFPLKALFKKRIVFNIGGIEWQKVRGKKALASIEVVLKKWFEKLCVLFSDVIIVDNIVLLAYVKKTYAIDSTLAEYGGDHATIVSISKSMEIKYPFLKKQYDISISRAQEDMNIHLLLDAYRNISDRNLVIISNWDTSDYGKKLKHSFQNKYPNIFLHDAVYNLEELNAIRSNADLYFHTHSLCGTAPSLVEAMSLGLPVICFNVPTNVATTENKSYYFDDSYSLREVISTLTPSKKNDLGIYMREIANRRYNWKRIVSIYKNSIN